MIRTLKTERRIALGIFDGDLTVSESRAGAFVTATIVLIAIIAIPFARPFLLGAVGLGSILGITLWWKHTRADGPKATGTRPELDRMIRTQ